MKWKRAYTIYGQIFVPGKKNRIKHRLKHQKVAHPFRNDYINFLNRQLDLFHLTFQKDYIFLITIFSSDIQKFLF